MSHKKTSKNRKRKNAGLPPGSLIFTGEQKMEQIQIHVIQYEEAFVSEHSFDKMYDLVMWLPTQAGKVWINIEGLHDEDAIAEICGHLQIHRLTAEDVLNIGQRPKIDEHRNYLHIVCKMLQWDSEEKSVIEEQLTMILFERSIITFQEKTGDVFAAVRHRILDGKGTIRQRGVDYLLYALLDAVIDHYFIIIETLGEQIESLETIILDHADDQKLDKIHRLRREILNLRRSVYPLRDVINKLERQEPPIVQPDTGIFIRDLYDHTIQVIETIEVFRDMVAGLLDLYMNSINRKMNEIMKVLTIIATIFIPLTFIVGVYGMNFDHMPELHWPIGYPLIWLIMLLVVGGMIFYFKRKRWM
jgi:magnesium transporter